MADAEFTPGPWVVDKAYPGEVQTDGLKTIASCWHEHAEGAEIIVTGVLACSLEEAAANARLIAAAPELLEALQLVWDTYGMDPSVDSSIWQTVRTAIAKALGQ